MMTRAEYIESLRRLNLKVYFMGELIENPVDHPMIRPSMNSVAKTYELAEKPEYQDLMTVYSPLIGKRINRFCHLHQSTEDLVNKVKMQRLMGQKTAACFQRCVGMDAFNAIFSTTYEMDQKLGTEYHKRFTEYMKFVQENDLTVDGAMTDPKGDRSLSPSRQEDPDMYMHVVEVREDGIVVRGAKAHQTGAVNSHEHLIMPTVAMKRIKIMPFRLLSPQMPKAYLWCTAVSPVIPVKWRKMPIWTSEMHSMVGTKHWLFSITCLFPMNGCLCVGNMNLPE